MTNVETADVIGVLTAIWTQKPETANRVRQRIEAVIDYATALGIRTGDNPARWRGHLDHLLPKPSKVRAVKHHPALPHAQIADFMGELVIRTGVAARPNGSLGRCLISHYQIPIKCGTVFVRPGDIVVGDMDGVIVVPRGVAFVVLERAEEILRNEKEIFDWVEAGDTLEEITGKGGYF